MADPTALYEKLLATLDGEEFQPRCANDPPWFCGAEEYKTAVAALRAVVKLHAPAPAGWPVRPPKAWQCGECASRCHSGSGLHCDDPDAEWPCSTISSVAEALGVSLDG